MEIVSIPAIVAIVSGAMEVLKKAINKEWFNRWIPVFCVLLGAILGIGAFYVTPEIIPATSWLPAIIIGAASGWAATGANQAVKQLTKGNQNDENH